MYLGKNILWEIENKIKEANNWLERGKNALKSEEIEIAEDYFNEALDVLPDCKEALNYLGEIYIKRRNYKRARRLLKRSLRIDPDYEGAKSNLGITSTHLKSSELNFLDYGEFICSFIIIIIIVVAVVVFITTGIMIPLPF